MPNETPKYKSIITLATSTSINDKAESVLIPKVHCSNTELVHVSACMACEHHLGVPNPHAVACGKPEETEADKKTEAKPIKKG